MTTTPNVLYTGITRVTGGRDGDGAAQRLAERAHALCPYSKALHANLQVVTTVA